MKNPLRGEVWIVDLGIVGKIRPCVVISVPILDEDRALITVIPHTTQPRGTRFEAQVSVPFLRAGVFDAQGLQNAVPPRFERRIGTL
jgi:mRNA interferase MazF